MRHWTSKLSEQPRKKKKKCQRQCGAKAEITLWWSSELASGVVLKPSLTLSLTPVCLYVFCALKAQAYQEITDTGSHVFCCS